MVERSRPVQRFALNPMCNEWSTIHVYLCEPRVRYRRPGSSPFIVLASPRAHFSYSSFAVHASCSASPGRPYPSCVVDIQKLTGYGYGRTANRTSTSRATSHGEAQDVSLEDPTDVTYDRHVRCSSNIHVCIYSSSKYVIFCADFIFYLILLSRI